MVSAAEQYDARIMKLDTEAARLWGLGQFGEALRPAREAAQLGEQLYGADDHRVGELTQRFLSSSKEWAALKRKPSSAGPLPSGRVTPRARKKRKAPTTRTLPRH
jgi:hypothetical protein